jgi:chromosome segregation ATPase
MSEERFDRLEGQLNQVIQAIGSMQQNMSTKQDVAAVDQKVSGIEQKVSGIEQRVSGIEQRVSGIEQRVSGIEQRASAMENNLDAVREDIIELRRRVESNEGTLIVAIRDGFRRQEDFINDLNFDLANNERKTRRLSRRVSRLERQDLDD